MSAAIRGKTAIVGIGSAGVGEAPGYSAIELLGQASLKAIADAGLKLSDIDAIFAATSSHAFPTLSVAEYLGIRPKFVDGTNIGGSSFELHLLRATLALEAGLCDAALICYGSNQRTAGVPGIDERATMARDALQAAPPDHRLCPGGQPTCTSTAPREQLAEVAVSARQWANLNPRRSPAGR